MENNSRYYTIEAEIRDLITDRERNIGHALTHAQRVELVRVKLSEPLGRDQARSLVSSAMGV